MKTEDIDKKIGMPDIDDEWAKFEREVIGEEDAKTRKRAFVGWTMGIAASIAFMAGIFLWVKDTEKQTDGSNQLAQTTNVQKTEERNATDVGETNAAPDKNSNNEDAASNSEKEHAPDNRESNPSNNRKDNPSTHILAQTTPQPTEKKDEQAPAVDDMTESQNVFSVVEQQPYFRGGDRGLQEFIKQNLRYPSTAQAYGVSGRVVMQFMIDRGGYVSDAKARRFFLKYDTLLLSRESEAKQTELKEQIAQQLEEECARVIAMMPRWTPGKIQGKVVSMKYNLPFLFKPSEFLANTSDTLSEAYVRQHPEVKQSRRYVTGYVVNEETNEPLSNANIFLSLWSDFGTMTDSTGHFAFWPPLTTDTLYASCNGYVTRKFHITGTKLIIRLSSATKIKDVPVKRQKK